jgi:hypothetical protein
LWQARSSAMKLAAAWSTVEPQVMSLVENKSARPWTHGIVVNSGLTRDSEGSC